MHSAEKEERVLCYFKKVEKVRALVIWKVWESRVLVIWKWRRHAFLKEWGMRVCSMRDAKARQIRCPTIHRERSTSLFRFYNSWIQTSNHKHSSLFEHTKLLSHEHPIKPFFYKEIKEKKTKKEGLIKSSALRKNGFIDFKSK